MRSNISGVKFGTIYQIGEVSPFVNIGDVILFRESSVICRLAIGVLTYTIINEEQIVLTAT